MVNIKFPDGNIKQFEKGITVIDIAKSISPGLAKNTLAGKVNGQLVDVKFQINEDSEVFLVTSKDKEALEVLRHSASHILAAAIKSLRPNAMFGVGPAIEEGFYYDVDVEPRFTEEEIAEIEKVMNRIISSALDFEREEITKEKAKEIFAKDKYKMELIDGIEGQISIYRLGDFVDLCTGPHLQKTSQLKFFKLLSIAGAYWRGDAQREQLQRIYGTAFFTKEELDAHMVELEERKERDHRRLGKQLRIFEINQDGGQGLAMWLPNGYRARKAIEDYLYKKEVEYGYDHISTPVMGPVSLYETSGHWQNYQENMFPVMERDGERYVLRPMSCPHHMLVFKSDLRSYKDLPIKYSETVIQHRYEASGGLTGLERVRGMTLTDSHMFVRPDQIKDTIKEAYQLITEVINKLGLKIAYVELALRGPAGKYHKDDALWDKAETTLREVLEDMKIEYTPMPDEAAFYGPKIDIQVKTAAGRIITLSTVQLDFLLPERFDLSYIDENGEKQRPVVIHRGLVGTYERLMSILLEQYKGALPAWMAPTQAVIIPVSDAIHGDFAREVFQKLKRQGYRVELDSRNERLGLKIREAQVNKIPFQIVIGDDEMKNNSLNIRKHGSEAEEKMTIEQFAELLK